jgi:hypothetical protein
MLDCIVSEILDGKMPVQQATILLEYLEMYRGEKCPQLLYSLGYTFEFWEEKPANSVDRGGISRRDPSKTLRVFAGEPPANES